MSMQAIRQWAQEHSPQEVRNVRKPTSRSCSLPEEYVPVRRQRGTADCQSLGGVRSFADSAGTALLAEVPQLNEKGKFNGNMRCA